MNKILVIDDEQGIRSVLSDVLTDEGFQVLVAGTGKDGLKLLEKEDVDLIILDVWLPDASGIEVLQEIISRKIDIPVVVISGHANIDVAVKAVTLGAYDFLEKPLSIDKLMNVINNALEISHLKSENNLLKAALGQISSPIEEGTSLTDAVSLFEQEYINSVIKTEDSLETAATKLQISLEELKAKLKK